ncbi:protein kinase [Candidatus Woesearchaeota archaeon]|nr:protein kinase [Candidatus Woesearchaeota archaeon]
MGTLDLLESQYGEEALNLSINGTISLDGLKISELEIESFSPIQKKIKKPPKAVPNGSSTLGKKELIGEGGMGSIYSTMQKSLERSVALKELKPGLANNQGHKEKFLEEAVITAQLEHPNIPPIHNLSRENCRLTMKKIKGKDLEGVMEEGKHSKKELVRMLIPVCDALAYGHARGVLHKDIKPANVMVGSEQGEVFMMDWGVAQINKAKNQSDALKNIRKKKQLQDGSIAGTPAYMAPEQAMGEVLKLDERADIYAFGVMLYEIQTGNRPVTLKKGQGGIIQLLAKKINPDTKIRKARGDLGAIAHKCMAFDKKDRYKNMLEVKKDLQNFLENQKISARKYGPIASTVKWVQNNAGKAVAALGISAGLLLGGTAGIVALNANAEKARVEAKNSKLSAAKERAEAETLKADAKAKHEAEKRAEAAEKAKTALEGKLVAEQHATASAQKAQTEAEKRAEAEKAKADAEIDAKKSLEEKLKAEQELSQLSERKRKAVLLNIDAYQKINYAKNMRDKSKKDAILLEAMAILRKAKEQDSKYAQIQYNMGRIQNMWGNRKKAIAHFTMALQSNSNYGYSYLGRGTAYSGIGEFEKAIADFKNAKQALPLENAVYCNLGICYLRAGTAKKAKLKTAEANIHYQMAIPNFKKAIEINPDDGFAMSNLGGTYLEQEKYKQAEKILLAAIIHGDYYSHIFVAETLCRAAKAKKPLYSDWRKKAKEHLDRAVAIDKNLAKEAAKVRRNIR